MSTVLMLQLVQQGKNVTALTIVGERTTDPIIRKEIQAAIMVCRMYGINHEMVDISSLQAVIGKYNMIEQPQDESDADLTEEQLHEKDRNAVAAIRPSAETLYAMGMQVAQSLGTDAVFAGKPTPDVDLVAELGKLMEMLQPRLINAPWAPWKATEAIKQAEQTA